MNCAGDPCNGVWGTGIEEADMLNEWDYEKEIERHETIGREEEENKKKDGGQIAPEMMLMGNKEL